MIPHHPHHPRHRATIGHTDRLGAMTVTETSDGFEAVEVVEGLDAPVDLILTDVVMPRMKGPELAERMAKATAATSDASQPEARETLEQELTLVDEMLEIAETFEAVGVPGGFHRAAAELYARLADLRDAAAPPSAPRSCAPPATEVPCNTIASAPLDRRGQDNPTTPRHSSQTELHCPRPSIEDPSQTPPSSVNLPSYHNIVYPKHLLILDFVTQQD